MAQIPHYPVNDFGPLMKGMVIGGIGIVHVFVAQFAIGGGMLLWYFERLAQRGREPKMETGGLSPTLGEDARRFIDGYFQVLVLVSFVLGALTGVAIWFTTIQVGARTIGLMVDEFHWLWATEWVCFSVEVAAGYAFVQARQAARRSEPGCGCIALYAIAAWLSRFFINGILSWQLTPGRGVPFLGHGDTWAGFFNPSFWPSLLYRTCVAMALAALAACVVINTLELDRARRAALIRRASRFAAPMIAMPVLAIWYVAVIPSDSRAWLLGGSTMTMFVAIAAGASLLIGGYAVVALMVKRLYVNGATATLLLALAFGATAAGEFVREGARKPYTVRGALYSTSIAPIEVAHLPNEVGVTADDPYPLRDDARYAGDQLRRGAKVHRALCDACHTMRGANALVELTRTWTDDQLRLNIAKLQHTKSFMPPFAGNAEDVEALVQLLRWETEGAPSSWPMSTDPTTLADIARWLDEAGILVGGGPGAPTKLPGYISNPPTDPPEGVAR